MKFLIVCACLIVATNALDKAFVEKFLQLMQEIGTKCVEETNASDDDVAKLISHQIPSTHEGQCMIFCFHKAFNIQNSDGSLNLDGAIASLDPIKPVDADLHGKLSAVFTSCIMSTTADADPCVTATRMAECGIKEGKAMGLKEELFEV